MKHCTTYVSLTLTYIQYTYNIHTIYMHAYVHLIRTAHITNRKLKVCIQCTASNTFYTVYVHGCCVHTNSADSVIQSTPNYIVSMYVQQSTYIPLGLYVHTRGNGDNRGTEMDAPESFGLPVSPS